MHNQLKHQLGVTSASLQCLSVLTKDMPLGFIPGVVNNALPDGMKNLLIKYVDKAKLADVVNAQWEEFKNHL